MALGLATSSARELQKGRSRVRDSHIQPLRAGTGDFEPLRPSSDTF